MNRRLARIESAFALRFGRLFGRRQGERGAIAVLAALLMTVMVFATALSVDLMGRVMQLRQDQAAADTAAVDAAWGLPSSYANSECQAFGLKAPCSLPSNITTTSDGSSVTVTVASVYNDFFGRSRSNLSRTAVATSSGRAQFSIGTTLADINAGLGPFGHASLGLVGYQGLASGSVTLGALATQLGLSALTPDQVLGTSVTVSQLASAEAALLSANGNPTGAASLTALATSLAGSFNSSNQVNIGQVLNLQQGTGVGLGATTNLLQILEGGIQLANGKAGITLPVTVGLPGGVTGVSVKVTAIIPPTVSAYGPTGISATNTQVTAQVSLTVSLGGLLSVSLPLNLTMGGATGTLTNITCSGGATTSIQVGTSFNTLSAIVGSGGTVNSSLLGPLASVTGNITVPSNAVAGTPIPDAGTPTAGTPGSFDFEPPANTTPNPFTPTAVAVSSSPGTPNVALNFSALSGLGLGQLLALGGLTNSLLSTALTPVLTPVLTAVSNTLGSTLGISVNTADYVGVKAACALPSLVH